MRLTILLLIAKLLSGAVAYSAHKAGAPTTSSSPTTGNFTPSGSNLAFIVHICLASLTATVSSVAWSLGSGTITEIANKRQVDAFCSVWKVPAPVIGTAAVTASLSASVPWQIDVQVFTGADQTDPAPNADATSAGVTGTGTNGPITPSNLTANDAVSAGDGHTVASDCAGITPNAVYTDSSTNINLQTGYSLGNTSVSATYASESGLPNKSLVAVRVAAVSAGAAPAKRLLTLGVGD